VTRGAVRRGADGRRASAIRTPTKTINNWNGKKGEQLLRNRAPGKSGDAKAALKNG